jgi:probable rRNA maturation factor
MPPAQRSRFRIEIANNQETLPVDEKRLKRAVRAILTGEGIQRAAISIAIVDDPAIHVINRKFLQHDEPTDCISFVHESSEDFLEGEVVASVDTALTQAKRLGVPPEDELLLYVVHGTLHITGYDDLTPEAAVEMRAKEKHYLEPLGITPKW